MSNQVIPLYTALHNICAHYRRLQLYSNKLPGGMWYLEVCAVLPTTRACFYCVLKVRNPWIPIVRIHDTFMHYSHSPTAMRLYRTVVEWEYLSEKLKSNVKPINN